MTPKVLTFIIPVYKLKSQRLNNLRFILPYLVKTKCRIIVVEQNNRQKSELAKEIKKAGVEHVVFKSKSKEFHKTGIINWAVKNHVKTKYVWVNDADFYIQFSRIIKQLRASKKEKFIKPYNIAKKLTEQDTKKLLKGEELEVSFEDGAGDYMSLYSALAFIFEKKEFLKIGGMDETIFGWGKEDIEFDKRVRELNYVVSEIKDEGIHLWHPTSYINLPFAIDSKKKDMAVMVSHFNWCGFISPKRSLNDFLTRMNIDGVPVYGVELSLTDKFETEGREHWTHIQVDKHNLCFQKEACLNLLEKRVPKRFKKIAWIDPDFVFTNKNWYEDTSAALDTYKVVQMFDTFVLTDRCGRMLKTIPSIMANGGPAGEKVNGAHAGQPGGAWAAQRELWRHGGLYSYTLMGGGDTSFVYTIFDELNDQHVLDGMGLKHGVNFKPFKQWRKKIFPYVNKSASYIPGTIIHMWHGDIHKRNYSRRYELMEEINFKTSVKLDRRGLIKIVNVSEEFYKKMKNNFRNRYEDGEDVIKAKKEIYKETIKYFKNKEQGVK